MQHAKVPPFQAFLDANRAVVYRFLLASVGPGQAEDCFQETFLSALRAYPRLRDGSNLRGWVLAIASRKAVDHRRGAARSPLPVGDAAALEETGTSPDASEAAEATLISERDPLWRAVRALPPRQRSAVVLRHVLDRPYPEVAAVLGCSEEAARANVHQGLKRLRKELLDDHE